MAKLTIVRGVSGSGKSTWTDLQPGNPVVVSRDRIRMAMFGSEQFIDEDLVTKVEHDMIRRGLRAGRNVISDNTNIQLKFVRKIAQVGEEEGAVIEVKTFDIPLKEAKARNAARALAGGRDVPEHVIEKQYGGLQSTLTWTYESPYVIEPYVADPELPAAVLCDIDGTLAHMDGKRGPFEWHNVGRDRVDEAVKTFVNIAFNEVENMILLSGRDGISYEPTTDWLIENDIYFDDLLMREQGDMRRDDIVKLEIFNRDIRPNYNVLFVIDDRAQVVRMWKRLGLKVFNVAGADDGEF